MNFQVSIMLLARNADGQCYGIYTQIQPHYGFDSFLYQLKEASCICEKGHVCQADVCCYAQKGSPVVAGNGFRMICTD